MINLISLVLAGASIILPVVCMFLKKVNGGLISGISLSIGIVSVFAQLCEFTRRVNIQDWTALADTAIYILYIVLGYSILLIMMNIVLGVVCSNRKGKHSKNAIVSQ